MITVYIDPNEGNGPRLEALRRVVAEKPDRYRLEERHQALDLCISDGERRIWWELKDKDLGSSMISGHLAQQCRQASALGDPALIAYFGSVDDALMELPIQNGDQLRGFEADLFASQFPIQFLSRSHTLSFKLILSRSRRWLEAMADGKFPMAGWLPKAPDWQLYALCGLPGVGPERARAILEKGIKPHLYAWQAGYDGIDRRGLEDQLMGVDGVGKVTAKKIMEAVR